MDKLDKKKKSRKGLLSTAKESYQVQGTPDDAKVRIKHLETSSCPNSLSLS